MRSRFVIGLCFFFSCAILSAQTISTSQIRGTIIDASGAPVPGAEVTLTQTATGAVRTATSRTDGGYTLPELPIGPYQLTVTKQGFSKYVQNGIVLQVGANPTIDVTLQVGSMTQEVTVQAAAQMVEIQNTGVGQVTAPQEVQDLPLNGRQITDLLSLAPATGEGRAFRASYPSSAVISIAGGAQGSVAYWLDGGTHNDPLSNQNLPLPFPDTVEEFKVETSSLPAQYGTHPSGTVNVVTKSGTNSFHGDAFEYLRNYIFDSRNTAFAAASPVIAGSEQQALLNSPRDNLKRNQFGGTVGGPIQKDKLFFFLGWQDTIQRSTNPATTTLPTAAMLAGNFEPCLGNDDSAPLFSDSLRHGRCSPNTLTRRTIVPSFSRLRAIYPWRQLRMFAVRSPIRLPRISPKIRGSRASTIIRATRTRSFGRYFITNWVQPPGSPNLPASSGGLLIAAIDGQSDRVQSLTLRRHLRLQPELGQQRTCHGKSQ